MFSWLALLNFFQSCKTSNPYSPLAKKNEDSPLQQAQAWVASQPIEGSTYHYLTIEKAEDYGKKIIQSLKRIPINSSNEDIIYEHLVQVCQINCHVAQYVFNHISDLNADKAIKRRFEEHRIYV